MLASQLAFFALIFCLKWSLLSSDFLSRNCRNVGNCFAAGVPDSEGEDRLRLVWLVRVSEALPTVLSLKDNDASDSTFAPQFGQKANDTHRHRNSGKTCLIDQRWLLFATKTVLWEKTVPAVLSTVNNMFFFSCSILALLITNGFVYAATGLRAVYQRVVKNLRNERVTQIVDKRKMY